MKSETISAKCGGAPADFGLNLHSRDSFSQIVFFSKNA